MSGMVSAPPSSSSSRTTADASTDTETDETLRSIERLQHHNHRTAYSYYPRSPTTTIPIGNKQQENNNHTISAFQLEDSIQNNNNNTNTINTINTINTTTTTNPTLQSFDHASLPPSPSPLFPRDRSVSVTNDSESDDESALKDEYGSIDLSTTHQWSYEGEFHLENGACLRSPTVNYKCYGTLNTEGDNALLVAHALTGYAVLDAWWGELLGAGKPFDTDQYFIVCANLLGSCYGTTGPLEMNPLTHKPYGIDFPIVTIRDTVRLHSLLLRSLGVNRIASVIGGSLGGMQSLEWAFFGTDFVQSFVAIACGAKQSAWQIAINHVQREAIYADPKWKEGRYERNQPPNRGLSIARQLAMITYRTAPVYAGKYQRKLQIESRETTIGGSTAAASSSSSSSALPSSFPNNNNNNSSSNNSNNSNTNSTTTPPPPHHPSPSSPPLSSPSVPQFAVEGYLEYQGDKLCARFDAISYIRLTQMLDTHDVGRGRGGIEKALSSLAQPALILGVSSDVLYPPAESRELAHLLPHAIFNIIESKEGHDGFLLEQHQIGSAVKRFLSQYAIPVSVQKRLGIDQKTKTESRIPLGFASASVLPKAVFVV